MQINFTARYIKPIEVKKLEDKTYNPAVLSFVEFEPNNLDDLSTLCKVSHSWGRSYAKKIYDNAYKKFFNVQEDPTFYYGLVVPQDSYEKIDKKDVLGLVEYMPSEQNGNFITYLQVNPNSINKSALKENVSKVFNTIKNSLTFNDAKSRNENYKGVGTGILDALKSMTKDEPIFLVSDKSAEGFYLKNGFSKIGDDSNWFVWYRAESDAKNYN